MRILFLGDVVGIAGCSKLMNNLLDEIKSKKIDFVIVNGENAAHQGVGLTKEICNDFFNCGVDVITTGNHVWDQKEIMEFIDKEERLLRPKNLYKPAPGKGFNIYNIKSNIKIGVLNLMGNVFMKKCEDVFEISEKFLKQYKLKIDEPIDLLHVTFSSFGHHLGRIHDENTLTSLLTEAGFRIIERFPTSKSKNPVFQNLEKRVGSSLNWSQLCLEAVK